MANVRTLAWSSIGKKYISGVTGVLLVLFLVVHLAGNLTLYAGADVFNHYADFLEHVGHGAFVYVAEAGLILFFLLHMGSGVSVALKKRTARDQAYYTVADAGGSSRKSLSSRTMILSGIVLLVFVVLHVRMFKFANPMPMMEIGDGREIKDLYQVVVKAFADPLIIFCYTAAMVLLGSHLRHGVWSAFQSLGWNHPRYMPAIYAGGIAVGLLIAFGFALIPLILFTFNEHFAARGGF